MKSVLIAATLAWVAAASGVAQATPSDPVLPLVETAPAPDPAAPLTHPPAGPVHFMVGTDTFSASAPGGYCDPAGALSSVSGVMTAWAEKAHLDLGAVWVRCDFHRGQSGPIKLALVAAKGEGGKIPYSRKVFVKAVADALPTPAGHALMAEGVAKGEAASSDPTAVTKLESQPQVVGLDADAVYIMVDADRTSQTSTFQFSVVEALTLIRGHIAVFAYAVIHGSPADKAEMVANSKRDLKTFIAENGG